MYTHTHTYTLTPGLEYIHSSVCKSLHKCLSFFHQIHLSPSPPPPSVVPSLPPSRRPPPLPLGSADCGSPQNAAQLYQPLLHLGNSRELGLEPELLVLQGNTCGGVQLFKAPAALAVKLQQVGVVLPVTEEVQDKVSHCDWFESNTEKLKNLWIKPCAHMGFSLNFWKVLHF